MYPIQEGVGLMRSLHRRHRLPRWARLFALAFLVAGGPVTSRAARAGDWPQLLGPERNNQAVNEQLPTRLPQPFSARLSYPLGAGYAGPAVSGERIVVFHRLEHVERLEALRRDTGESLWQADFPAEYEGGYNPDTGPRCVPTVHGDVVLGYGANGRLHCVSLADGKQRWTRHLDRDYQTPEGYFGVGSSPLVSGELVLVHVGGRAGAGIVALELATGKTVWTATDDNVSYASPVLATLHTRPTALFLSRYTLFGVDPQQGTVLFQHPFGKRGLTVTGTTPLVFGNSVFLSASYNIGAELVQIQPEGKVVKAWGGDDILSSQYSNAVHINGYLYGTHGREDGALSELRCVDAATGHVQWRHAGTGVGHLIAAGQRLLLVEVQHGNVVLLQANPQKYEELDRRHVTDDSLRPLPALANGELYLRTHSESGRGRLLVLPCKSESK